MSGFNSNFHVVKTIVTSGGGDANDMTVPASPLPDLAADAEFKTVVLTNDGTTPASVELDFTNDYLQGVDFDSGTAASPTYVVDPDVGPRTIQLERGSATVPADPTEETIDFTGNAGLIQSNAIDVFSSGLMDVKIRRLGHTPTIEFRMDAITGGGLLTDTGALGGNDATMGGLAIDVSSPNAGFRGYLATSAVDDYVKTNLSETLINRSTDRSWIWCWKQGVSIAGAYLSGLDHSGNTTGTPGWLGPSGASWKFSYMGGTPAAIALTAAKATSRDGAGSALDLATTDNLDCMVILSYVHATTTTTIRWKSSADTDVGHTVYTDTVSAQTGTTSYDFWWVGYSSSYCTNPIQMNYIAVTDSIISASDFNALASAIGL
jgi:hypothetical protein